MSDIALEFRGAKTDPDGSTTHHLAVVWEPQEDVLTQTWSCIVGCYSLVAEAERITGANAAQALRLAKLFVMDLLEDHGVVIEALDREQ